MMRLFIPCLVVSGVGLARRACLSSSFVSTHLPLEMAHNHDHQNDMMCSHPALIGLVT
jgi:hypothetical protein